MDGPQGWSEQMRKISAPPGFDLRTVQPVASRYTDYATLPIIFLVFTPNLYSKEIKRSDFLGNFNVVKKMIRHLQCVCALHL